MKIFVKLLVVLIASLPWLSCATGYVSKDGAVLKKYLTPEGLQQLTHKPDPAIWIVDLRSGSAYAEGHIPTAKSFPIGEIMNRLNEVSKDQYMILYCIFSPGAQMTIRKLEKEGYTKLMNWGAYSRWPFATEKGAPASPRTKDPARSAGKTAGQ